MLPQMPNLAHLIISTKGKMYDEATAPMLACIQQLLQLETLDLKLIGRHTNSNWNIQVRAHFYAAHARTGIA